MKIINVLCAAVLLFFFVSIGSSEELKRSATVAKFSGEVMVRNPGPGSWALAKVGDILNEGSFIKTGAGAKAVINIDNGQTAIVDVSEKSLVSFITSEVKFVLKSAMVNNTPSIFKEGFRLSRIRFIVLVNWPKPSKA